MQQLANSDGSYIFHSQDLSSKSPLCLQYNSYHVSLANLVLDQLGSSSIIDTMYVSLFFSFACWIIYGYCKQKIVLVTHRSDRIKRPSVAMCS